MTRFLLEDSRSIAGVLNRTHNKRRQLHDHTQNVDKQRLLLTPHTNTHNNQTDRVRLKQVLNARHKTRTGRAVQEQQQQHRRRLPVL